MGFRFHPEPPPWARQSLASLLPGSDWALSPGYGLGLQFLGHPSIHALGWVCSKGQCPRSNSDLSGNYVAKEGSWEWLLGARDFQRATPGARANLAGWGTEQGVRSQAAFWDPLQRDSQKNSDPYQNPNRLASRSWQMDSKIFIEPQRTQHSQNNLVKGK